MLTRAQFPLQLQQALAAGGVPDIAALDAVPPATLQRALLQLSELVTSSLAELAGQPAGREQLWHLAQEAAAAGPVGTGLVRAVLADRFHGTVHAAAAATSLPPAAVPKLLDAVAAVALGLLGGLVAEHRWSAAQLAQWLRPHQAQPVPAAVPRGAAPTVPAPSWLRAHWLLVVLGLAAAAEAGYLLGTRSAGAAVASPPVASPPVAAAPALPQLTDSQGRVVGPASTEGRLYQQLTDTTARSSGLVRPWIVFDQLYFARSSAVLTAASRVQLSNVASLLKQFPAAQVAIGGYTDNSGSPLANLRLSKARAEAIRRALVYRGVPARRLTATGYGELGNVASNDTEAGRAANQRVSLQVVQ